MSNLSGFLTDLCSHQWGIPRSDSVRRPPAKETRSVIKQLQSEYGMSIYLLTGDNQTRARAVANELSIPANHIHAEAFPEQKAEVVRQLHEAGKTVAFTGDGLNDSVALAYADVSVSFGNGSEVARETADVVLMNNDLVTLLQAIAIAKQTMGIIQQNTALAVAPNLAALGLASTVGLHPLAATVVHNGSAIRGGFKWSATTNAHSMSAAQSLKNRRAVTVPSGLTIEATAIVLSPRSTPQTFCGLPSNGGVISKGTARNIPL
jgi:soluble P-type ATPase